MTDADAQEQPRTIGDLRRRLAELGNPWTVDPQLSNDEPLRDRPRGGQADEEVPDDVRPQALQPRQDLRELLAGEPPANPFLRQRWVEEGLLDDDAGGLS
jgi:hypothetical protein